MIRDMKLQLNRLRRILVVISLAQISCLNHLSEYDISTFPTSFRISDRVIIRRVFTEANKCCCLNDCQIFRLFAKINIRGCFYTNCIMQEVKIIQIHRDYFVFGIITFQFHCYDPLYRFLKHTLQRRICVLGIELFCELLRDGRTSTCTFLSEETALNDSTSKSIKINTRMIIKANVLCSHQCLYQRLRQLCIVHHHTILAIIVPCAYNFSICRIYLSSKTVNRILQIFDRWHISDPPLVNCIKCSSRTQDENCQ